MELILASTSPYRRALLESLGIAFRCVAPGVDERETRFTALAPKAMAEALAAAKARAVQSRFPGATVIGCDQVAVVNDRVLGKPGDTENARMQLRGLSGRCHALITAVAVVQGETFLAHTEISTLWMRALSDETIRSYVETDNPIDCAGAYKLESHGRALFERIEADDPTAIIGMPMRMLARLLQSLPHAIL